MRTVQPLLNLDWNLLFSAITVLVLILILKHFFFEKVHNFMVQRESAVQNTLDHAAAVSEEADRKLAGYEAKLAGAQEEGRAIIKDARHTAKAQAGEILDEAKAQAEAMLEHSKTEIRREQYNARKELQEELSSMAILAAEQIMEKELNPKDHEDIVNKILEEAEETPWN